MQVRVAEEGDCLSRKKKLAQFHAEATSNWQRFQVISRIYRGGLPLRMSRLLFGQFALRYRFDDDRLQVRIQSLDQLVDGDSSPLDRHLGPGPTDNLAEFLESACSGGCWVAIRRGGRGRLVLGCERGKVAGEKGQADGVFKQVRLRVWRAGG